MRTFLDRWYLLGPSAALLVFLSLVALSYKDWRDYQVARADIDEAQDVVEQAYALVHSLDDAETEQREYVRIGDLAALHNCEDALFRIPTLVKALRNARTTSAESSVRLAHLAENAATVIASALESRRRGDVDAARDMSRANRAVAQGVRVAGQQLIASQRTRMKEENQTTYTEEQRVRAWVLGGAVVLFLLLLGTSIQISLLINRLRTAQQRYRLLFENNPQPMWVYDQATLAFLAVNNAAIRRYGYTEDEFLKMDLRDIQSPEDIEYLLGLTREPATELHTEGSLRHRKSDGTVISVEIIEHPIKFDGRQSALVIPRDITAQQEAEIALQKSRERLQLAFDAANEGLWDWNVETGEGYFSPRFFMILGYEPGEVATDHEAWRSLVHPDDLPAIAQQCAEQIGRQNGAFAIECRMRRKTGDYTWVQSRGKVIAWTNVGKPTRIVGTSIDINDRKALEAQYQQAQRLESIGRLAGGVAHDFNNLLTVINGYAEMALGQTDTKHPAHGCLEGIRGAGERAASLTQQLLAFSRKQLLQTTVVNINRSVAEVDKMLRRLIGEHITLVTHLSPDLGNVKADAGQLQQIIVNLVVNGRDAMPDGGTLIIETGNVAFDDNDLGRHPDGRPGRHIMLAIMDDGLGMSPEVEERIFEPFFTTKAKGVGTGLGLAMVHGIVMQSGGWISVNSEPGRGTAFKIYFPRTDEPISSPDVVSKIDFQGTETILIVEDQEEVRDLAATALRRCGYKVHTCANGEEALRFAAAFEDTIHLLISDVIMPGIDGMALAKVLCEQRSGLRSILMSGYTDNVLTQDGMLNRGIAYLQKPFTPGQLAEKAREVLSTQTDEPE